MVKATLILACVLLASYSEARQQTVSFDDNKYKLDYEVKEEKLELTITVQATGFVGIGFNPTAGTMAGAELVIAGYKANATVDPSPSPTGSSTDGSTEGTTEGTTDDTTQGTTDDTTQGTTDDTTQGTTDDTTQGTTDDTTQGTTDDTTQGTTDDTTEGAGNAARQADGPYLYVYNGTTGHDREPIVGHKWVQVADGTTEANGTTMVTLTRDLTAGANGVIDFKDEEINILWSYHPTSDEVVQHVTQGTVKLNLFKDDNTAGASSTVVSFSAIAATVAVLIFRQF